MTSDSITEQAAREVRVALVDNEFTVHGFPRSHITISVEAAKALLALTNEAPATEDEAAPSVPTFRFTGRATGQDPHGYYYPRWDIAKKVEVVAINKSEATALAFDMLGTHPRHGRRGFGDRRDTPGWAIIWDRVEQVSR